MSQYKKAIMNALLDDYEKRTVRSGRPVSELKLKKIFSVYQSEDMPNDVCFGVSKAVSDLESKGVLSSKKEKFGTRFDAVKLNSETAATLYTELHRVPITEKVEKKKKILEGYCGKNKVVDLYIENLFEQLSTYKIAGILTDDDKLNGVLTGLTAVLNNHTPVLYRQFSVNVYGDSKVFEQKYIGAICGVLREYYDFGCSSLEEDRDILESFGIFRVAPDIKVKGCAIITIAGQKIDVSKIKGGIGISAESLQDITSIKVTGTSVYTIENLTSFSAFRADDCFVVYLAGFNNSAQSEFLRQAYRHNDAGVNFYHFGDIDAGGFYIFLNLCSTTGIPFIPYKMDIPTLSDKSVIKKRLEANDVKRLLSLQKQKTCFNDTIEYMLKHDCKLEQEVLISSIF